MPQTLTAPTGLLTAEGAALPLVGVSARAEIRDYACRVVLTQRYRNDESQGGAFAEAAATARFTWAGQDEIAKEPRDLGIGREVARLDAARAERDALEKNRNGDYEGARKAMEACLIRIREYAGEDDELQKLMAALRSKALRYGRSMDKISSKHLYATSSLALRGRLIPKGNAVRGSGGSTPSGVVH